MSQHITSVKGTNDILPEESPKWRYIENTIHKISEEYNYREVRTPVFEETQLFARGVGEYTDIVTKEMYTFLDKGENSLTLKPELTAPIIRSYIQHHYDQTYPLSKIYYLTPLFRQERPQAGRQRQFHQYGIEAIGSEYPETDVEVIAFAMDVYRRLGLTAEAGHLELRLNSIGDSACRPDYLEALRTELEPHRSDLCKTCQERFESNTLRLFDCKNESCQGILDAHAPKITDHLCDECHEHFGTVTELLDELEIPYMLDHKLVRGLDYYTRTTFEITSDLLGAQDALCGGGRYDKLVEELGGNSTPAVGFAAGIERLIMALESEGLFPDFTDSIDLFIVLVGDSVRNRAYKILQRLREQGVHCDMDFLRRSVKAQFREANRQNADYTIVLGENELEAGEATIKNMDTGEEQMVSFDGLGGFFKRNL
ncbi:MAG: histidine--tRNA ligase [Candidatus Marinimicrobia bacterium]|nr:histidine--tRNA ligase [Candidatus Neomarinimicrobiota bacterium]MCF7829100.1 histidine--tRNA ligase [Candidatus Neomarinimicrobiota bacterium]MCF7881501.1 histidine--tRNA ligase [Candidatus Neomarinimicrobiota bacterium]